MYSRITYPPVPLYPYVYVYTIRLPPLVTLGGLPSLKSLVLLSVSFRTHQLLLKVLTFSHIPVRPTPPSNFLYRGEIVQGEQWYWETGTSD